MTAITGELNNPIIFKQYILNLLEEDALFKQQLLNALFKNNPPKSRPLRKYSKGDKQKYLKKYNISLEALQALQELFKDQPPAHEIIQDIKNPIPKTVIKQRCDAS